MPTGTQQQLMCAPILACLSISGFCFIASAAAAIWSGLPPAAAAAGPALAKLPAADDTAGAAGWAGAPAAGAPGKPAAACACAMAASWSGGMLRIMAAACLAMSGVTPGMPLCASMAASWSSLMAAIALAACRAISGLFCGHGWSKRLVLADKRARICEWRVLCADV